MEVLSSPSFGFRSRLKIGFFVGREGPLFARALTEFVDEVRAMGPSPLNDNPTYRSGKRPDAPKAEAPAPPEEPRLVKVEDI
jgi:hypothetical protein